MVFIFAKYYGIISLATACTLSLLFNQLRTKGDIASTVLLHIRGGKRNSDQDSPQTSSISDSDLPDTIFDVSIPGCARDVFLTLNGVGDHKNLQCRGMLLRDDIILTSSRCSKFEFTFDFPDENVGELRAFPHTSLVGESIDPRLGFLEANPPYHYQFVHQPVRRMRMFLSRQSSAGKKGGDEMTGAIMTCKGNRPIAHNFPVSGELVPLDQLFGVVPDDILWEHLDITSAPALNDGSHRWFARAVTLEEEEEKLKNMIRAYEGVPGGVSIPHAHPNKFISQAGALCEALDPRGHRLGYCFKNYLPRWLHQKPAFSGMSFFDWFDYGHGKFLLERNETEKMIVHMRTDKKCLKEDFNKKNVYYFNETETSAHEVYFEPSEDGTGVIGRYRVSDQLVPPTSSADNAHFYMWDLNQTWYVVNDAGWNETENGFLKHTSILAGRPALSAGHIFFGERGRLRAINWMSGHYKPNVGALSLVYQWMNDQRFNVSSFYWIGRAKWSMQDCNVHDWGGVKVQGYNGVALNRSCHEVTASPMWRLAEDDFSMFDELYQILGINSYMRK